MQRFSSRNRAGKPARLLGIGLLAWGCAGASGALTAGATQAPGAVGLGSDPASRPSGTVPSQESARRFDEQPPTILKLAAAQDPQKGPASGARASGPANYTPTYLGDILPILMRRCSRCHNQDARFVYNWLDYRTAYADRWEIRRRVWDSWRGSYFKESMPIANSPEALATTDEERLRIRNWVSSGSPRGVPPPPRHASSRAEKVELGRRMFTSICAACHQPTGRGIPNVFPPLAASDFLNANKDRAIKVVINGRQGVVVVNGQTFNNSMPSFPLSDEDIANVLTFVYNSFGNSGLEVNADEVKILRAQPPDEVLQGSVPSPVVVPPNPYE